LRVRFRRPISTGDGHLHEIHDQKGIAAHITRYAARINAPFEAPVVLTEAFRQATSGRQRPVFVECAMDMWGRRAPVELLGRTRRRQSDGGRRFGRAGGEDSGAAKKR